MRTYLCVYFGAALVVQLATPLIARVARALNIIDVPGARKVHTKAVPRIGGVAIVAGVLAPTLAVLALGNVIGDAFREVSAQVTVLLVSAILVFAVGLLDDIRSVPARLKLLSLVGGALALAASGARIDSITLDESFAWQLGWLSWPVTVLWVVGITVAMNFIDGLDGLAAGIAAVGCGVIAVLAFLSGQTVMAVLMLALLGSLTGFLFFNFNPAKIFMGDCGSMFLGFVIAGGSLVCQAKTSALVGLALPALALGVPLFDTMFTVVRRRILDRRSIFSAERGHIHHRLLDMGLNQRAALVVIYGVTLATAGVGMLMLVTRDSGAVAVLAFGILLLLVAFRIAGASRLRETLAAVRRNSDIARKAKEERHHFEDAQLQMRRAVDFEHWWRSLCQMAESMDFERLALTHRSDENTTDTYVWQRSVKPLPPEEAVSIFLPLGAGKATGASRIELTMKVNGSLETIGRRASLFGRLLDEHDLATVASRAKVAQPAALRSMRRLLGRIDHRGVHPGKLSAKTQTNR